MLEAMATTILEVSTDAGWTTVVIKPDEDDLIVPQRDHRTLAAVVKRLPDDPAA